MDPNISSPASEEESTSLRSIRYKRGQLHLLDQRKLPFEIAFIEISNSRQGWHAIKDMVVRGAPAIAIAAALSLAVELVNLEQKFKDSHEALSFIQERLDYLISSRPTAVNLFEAAKMLRNIVENAALSSSSSETVVEAYVMAAEGMLSADVRANKSIGSYGAKLIIEGTKRGTKGEKLRILTHCNTGSLATAAYGTALGVIRSLHSEAKVETAYCTETRPYNQGSRLTAFELMHDNIPAVLIADSAAGFLQASGKVDVVIVGADRVASNGDTANKIGTYNLALLSFHHGIPFYVAAPLTSIDMSILSGEQIVIEERPPLELTHSHGGQGSQIAAPGISVWNPAFDITPAKFITAIITDRGIITRKNGSSNFGIQSFLNELDTSTELAVSREMDASIRDFDFNKGTHNYRVLDEESVLNYISSYPNLARRLGGTIKNWTVREVGDGNLNFVYIVLGPSGSLVLKQAVLYVRCVGESWPLTSDRSYFEALVLKQHGEICPDHVPKLYHVNCSMGIIGMQYLEPPHIILRKGLIGGISYPLLAEHMSDYLAKTLYHTSLIAVSTKTHRSRVAEFCGNIELCRLTEQVIFTEPYMISPNNRWTPQLDEDVEAIREDAELKLEIANLKAKFCESAQALIHGDLHTGSIMVTTTSTKVIDPEFGFYGPIGFDIGAFLGNLVLAFFSQDGHATDINERHAYKAWILSTLEDTWRLFERKFISYWAANWENAGDAYPISVYKTSQEQELAQKTYVKEVFQDSLGFAAAKMIRRIIGIAHVEDFETIKDPSIRAQCEHRALVLAKRLIKRRHMLLSIGQVIEMVQDDL